ncbi:interaptin-like [Helianthus annuus]|uniref:interaptin-like n=1 Tax=Helianthus annuus TaxID=4232 RepID=UPI0016532094|nr:interaptin-like [Helianthus annuus]
MNNPSGQQDVKMYFKGSVQNVEASPKVQTAFSAESSSGSINQSPNSSSGFSPYSNVNPNVSTSSYQSQCSNNGNGYVIQCNLALQLQNRQSFSEEVAKSHMALLATVLESYEGLIVQEPDLMKEWMGMFANVEIRQDEESVYSEESSEKTQVFDDSSTDNSDDEEEMHINIGKSQLSPETKDQKKARCEKDAQIEKVEQNEGVTVDEKLVEVEKEVEIEKVVEVEKIFEVEKVVEVTKPCLKCLESCKQCEEKDEKYSELDKMKEKLLFDLNYVKESYDGLNRTVNSQQKTNSEREDALVMMNAVMMSTQKAINHYIEECFEAFKDEKKTEEKDTVSMSVEREGSSAPKRQKPNEQRKKPTREHGEGRLRVRINVHTVKAQDANKRKSLSQDVKVEEEPYYEFNGARVLSRVKPKNLTGRFINLNQNQRQPVEKMGFGAALKLKINSVPTMLGYWLVKIYNEKTNNLNVGNHTIHINEELINSLTNIPDGMVPVQGKKSQQLKTM